MHTNNYFVNVACPLCKMDKYSVVYSGTFPETLDQEFLKDIYRSSSEHALFEQVVRCINCSLVYLNPRLKEELIVGSSAFTGGDDIINKNPIRTPIKNRDTSHPLFKTSLIAYHLYVDILSYFLFYFPASLTLSSQAVVRFLAVLLLQDCPGLKPA